LSIFSCDASRSRKSELALTAELYLSTEMGDARNLGRSDENR
jgi:hypothetical protein